MDPQDILRHMNCLPADHMFPVAQTPKIPRLLHLIWVGNKPRPEYVNVHIQKWRELMPTWSVRLWTNEDIHTGEFPDPIVTLIGYAYVGAQKADIMRYHIVEKYGGIYVDTDFIPKRSFEDLIVHTSADAILCHELDITWVFIINAFFAMTPHHPIMKRACELCYTILVNTPDVYMQTGPRLLGEAVRIAPPEGEKYMLLPPHYLYWNDYFPHAFATHTFAKSWMNDQK